MSDAVAPVPAPAARRRLEMVVLVDDNRADNIFHSLVVEETALVDEVVAIADSIEALDILAPATGRPNLQPDILFLDLNLPVLNGWEFIDAYGKNLASAHNPTVVAVLSTSENPDDARRASSHPGIDEFLSKPLTARKFEDLVSKYFTMPPRRPR